MRNISFSMTTEQIRNRTKTVTRRLGWKFLKPGDVLNAVVKCQGLKKGEKVEHLCQIRVVSVNRESLEDIVFHEGDVEKEGFAGMTTDQFVNMFWKSCKTADIPDVTRIEFEYVA